MIFQVPLVFGSVNKLVPVHSFSNGYPSILVLDSTLDDSWWIFGKLFSTSWLQWFFVCAKLPREREPKIPNFFEGQYAEHQLRRHNARHVLRPRHGGSLGRVSRWIFCKQKSNWGMDFEDRKTHTHTHMSSDSLGSTLLFRVYRRLYYPVIWGLVYIGLL